MARDGKVQQQASRQCSGVTFFQLRESFEGYVSKILGNPSPPQPDTRPATPLPAISTATRIANCHIHICRFPPRRTPPSRRRSSPRSPSLIDAKSDCAQATLASARRSRWNISFIRPSSRVTTSTSVAASDSKSSKSSPGCGFRIACIDEMVFQQPVSPQTGCRCLSLRY
jgi:hypothetical protein